MAVNQLLLTKTRRHFALLKRSVLLTGQPTRVRMMMMIPQEWVFSGLNHYICQPGKCSALVQICTSHLQCMTPTSVDFSSVSSTSGLLIYWGCGLYVNNYASYPTQIKLPCAVLPPRCILTKVHTDTQNQKNAEQILCHIFLFHLHSYICLGTTHMKIVFLMFITCFCAFSDDGGYKKKKINLEVALLSIS